MHPSGSLCSVRLGNIGKELLAVFNLAHFFFLPWSQLKVGINHQKPLTSDRHISNPTSCGNNFEAKSLLGVGQNALCSSNM